MSLFPFYVEHLVDEETVRETIEFIKGDLVWVWKRAIHDWMSLDSESRARLSETPTVPPNVIYGFAISYAKERFRFREDEGIDTCEEIPGVFAFYVKGKLLVRFNSLNASKVVSTHDASDLKQDYFNQRPIKFLNNDATRIVCGYRLNETKSEIAFIGVSLQVGDTLAYFIDFDDCESIGAIDFSDNPVPDQIGFKKEA